MLGMILSSDKATLHELQTVYGVEDSYNLAELICVDAYNHRQVTKNANRN